MNIKNFVALNSGFLHSTKFVNSPGYYFNLRHFGKNHYYIERSSQTQFPTLLKIDIETNKVVSELSLDSETLHNATGWYNFSFREIYEEKNLCAITCSGQNCADKVLINLTTGRIETEVFHDIYGIYDNFYHASKKKNAPNNALFALGTNEQLTDEHFQIRAFERTGIYAPDFDVSSLYKIGTKEKVSPHFKTTVYLEKYGQYLGYYPNHDYKHDTMSNPNQYHSFYKFGTNEQLSERYGRMLGLDVENDMYCVDNWDSVNQVRSISTHKRINNGNKIWDIYHNRRKENIDVFDAMGFRKEDIPRLKKICNENPIILKDDYSNSARYIAYDFLTGRKILEPKVESVCLRDIEKTMKSVWQRQGDGFRYFYFDKYLNYPMDEKFMSVAQKVYQRGGYWILRDKIKSPIWSTDVHYFVPVDNPELYLEEAKQFIGGLGRDVENFDFETRFQVSLERKIAEQQQLLAEFAVYMANQKRLQSNIIEEKFAALK